jgi:hypothetical protein
MHRELRQHRIEVKEYANQFHDLLIKGVNVGYIKRLLYDDKDTQKRLSIKEDTIDVIWEALMDGTYNRDHLTNFGRYRRSKLREELPQEQRKYKRVILYSVITGQPKAIYESVYECMEKTGMTESTIRTLCASTAKKPRIILRYEGDSIGDVILGERIPSKYYTKKAIENGRLYSKYDTKSDFIYEIAKLRN